MGSGGLSAVKLPDPVSPYQYKGSDNQLQITIRPMKKSIIIIIVLIVLLGGYTYLKKGGVVEYKNITATSTTKEITVEVLDKRISTAIAASSTATEVEAYKAYTEAKTQIEKEIELKVISEYRAEIEKREAKLEKEVSL